MIDATETENGNPPGARALLGAAHRRAVSPAEALKRALDAVLAAALIVILAPVWIVAMLLVKLTSRGPVLYTQERLGWQGRRFTILKVRTMFHDCERLTGPLWATARDPRVTRVGRFLRRTHLDELPQLLNILRGEMSLVGPRPERPEIACGLELALPRYAERLQARPGLTGLAQIQLPPDSDLGSVRLKLALDLLYIERQGLWLDFRILACTGFFLLGIPFPVSCRLLRVGAEPEQPDSYLSARDGSDRVLHPQGIEC